MAGAAESYSGALQRLSTRFPPAWEIRDWSNGPISWRFFGPRDATSPSQGWKIHVSASAIESPKLLSAMAPILHELRAAFKIPRNVVDVILLNSGDAGAQILGKIVTIYPETDDHAREIIKQIDNIWPVSRGPEVQTDLHIRPGSAVSFRYGVFRDGPIVVSSTGRYQSALVLANGSLVPDTRSLQDEQSHAPSPPVPCCPPRPWPFRLNDTIQVNDREYMILAQLSASARTRIFLGVDLDRLESVVLKVGRPGVAGDESGVDIRDLLEREFLILSDLADQTGVVPRVLAWHDGHWPILVMEDFRGEVLSELSRSDKIKLLPHLASALVRVHAAGFIHGDVKLANAVRRGGLVGLIDFELAQHEGGDFTRTAGTRGHMAPEVAVKATAAYSRDVFALAGCIIEAILDLPPGLVPPGPGRLQGLLNNEGMAGIAGVVINLMAPDPVARPTASEAASALTAYVGGLTSTEPVKGYPIRNTERAWLRRASIDAAHLVSTYAQTDTLGIWWRNEHFMKPFACEAINLGAAGIIIGLATVDGAFGRSDFTAQIDQGARWLSGRSAVGNAAGVFSGNAGVALALAVAGRRLGNGHYIAAARERFVTAAADRREVDLFSGSGGVVWASCMLNEILQESWPLDLARDAVDDIGRIIDLSGDIPIWSIDPHPSYLGCSHGSAGIAMALAYWGRRTGDAQFIDMGLETFRRIRGFGRTPDGAALRITTKTHHHHFVGNWCHGVAGYLWSILQGVGDHAAVRPEIDWAVERLKDTMSVGTPTYCHGLAGQLELWRMLSDIPRFQALADGRAAKVVRALRIMHHKVDGRCTWIADDPAVTTPDLWIGFLGPATALALYAIDSHVPLLSGKWLTRCAAETSDQHSLQ